MFAKEIKNKQRKECSLKDQKISLGSKGGSRDNKHTIHECKLLIGYSKITKLLPCFFFLKPFQEKMKTLWELIINVQKVNTTVDRSR